MEGEVRWPGSGPGTADGSVAGGEHATEAACSRAYAGQDRCCRTCSQKNGEAFTAWTDGRGTGGVVWRSRTASVSSSACSKGDLPLPQLSRSTNRAADARDRSGKSALWIPQDPRAVEP